MKYPARKTSGKFKNCDNELADKAEAMALSVIAAVCPPCSFRATCLNSGYLGELQAVDAASVAIATHARAVFNGFDKLAAGRGEFIAVHEDAADTVCPNTAVTDADLQQSADVVASLLSDPKWLNWFGQEESRDEDGGLTPNEKLAERRNQLYDFVGRLADLIDRLRAQLNTAERTTSVTMPSPVSKAVGIERLLFRATLEAGVVFTNSPWRLLLAALTGELFSLGVIVDERRDAKSQSSCESFDDTGKRRMLVGTWKNLPPKDAVVIFADATASCDDLQDLLGRPASDLTPTGHIARAKRVVQFPIDLSRCTSRKRFLSILRGVLVKFPNAGRVGVITHSSLEPSLKKLSEPFAGRIIKSAYFGSGDDRASNDWHSQCDLVIVAGTPRVPCEAVQRRLIQFGDFDSACKDGGWGEIHWRGRTETGEEVVVTGLGYSHPGWERAHRSIVRAAIVQAAGRGRSLLEDGCDVAIISTEECGFPLYNKTHIRLSETETALLAILTELSAEKSYRDSKTLPPIGDGSTAECFHTTADLAERIGRSERQTRDILTRLESRRLVIREGERGGWKGR